ncbi:MAG TPA: response regulator transcription factor [Acidobacteriota bacterium]|nr:response regulator transcription factor [Acidobacteriota bacterium]
MKKRSTVILADDHILFRHGLRRILSERRDLDIVAEAGDGAELLSLLNKIEPELIFLDISMPVLRGIELIPDIHRVCPETKVLVLTMHKEEEYLYQAISAGADGYLLKEDAEKELFSAIDSVLQGKVYISPSLSDTSLQNWVHLRRGEPDPHLRESLTLREREVVKLIAEGKSNKEIADILRISVRTVERHRGNMMSKLNVKKTAELVQYAMRKHYI